MSRFFLTVLSRFFGKSTKYLSRQGARFLIGLMKAAGITLPAFMSTRYEVVCYDRDGNVRWREVCWNLVVNVGLNDLLDKRFKASSYTAADYVGLTDGAPTIAAGDTMASHAGWAEVTAYSEGTRPALTLGSVASQSVDNSASKASFSISGSATVGGAFIVTNSTKGGTSGILYGVAAFSEGDRAVQNGDTVEVTATLTAAAA